MTAKGTSPSVTNLPDPGEEGRERAMDLIITRPGVARQARGIPAGIPLIDTLHSPSTSMGVLCTHAHACQGGGGVGNGAWGVR